MSLSYEDVVTEENSHKVYLCKLVEDGGEYIHYMQVHDTCDSASVNMVLYKWDVDDSNEYRKEDILEIIEEVDTSDEDNYEDPDGEFIVDHDAIKHLYHESDVYKFNNKDELILLYKSMNDPRIGGVWSDDTYIDKLDENVFGVVFYWTEYDDWSCGHPYSYYMKIIFGVKC